MYSGYVGLVGRVVVVHWQSRASTVLYHGGRRGDRRRCQGRHMDHLGTCTGPDPALEVPPSELSTRAVELENS